MYISEVFRYGYFLMCASFKKQRERRSKKGEREKEEGMERETPNIMPWKKVWHCWYSICHAMLYLIPLLSCQTVLREDGPQLDSWYIL